MERMIHLRLAAMLVFVVATAAAQDEASLDFDDFVGVWNMVYDNGQTPSLAISRADDGTPTILVRSQFGERTVRDIVVEGNEITFNHESNATPTGEPFLIEYTARLVDGKLEGTAALTGLPAPLEDSSYQFTATRAE